MTTHDDDSAAKISGSDPGLDPGRYTDDYVMRNLGNLNRDPRSMLWYAFPGLRKELYAAASRAPRDVPDPGPDPGFEEMYADSFE